MVTSISKSCVERINLEIQDTFNEIYLDEEVPRSIKENLSQALINLEIIQNKNKNLIAFFRLNESKLCLKNSKFSLSLLLK